VHLFGSQIFTIYKIAGSFQDRSGQEKLDLVVDTNQERERSRKT
jgi:hypothetical protein